MEDSEYHDAGFAGATERARRTAHLSFTESRYSLPVRMAPHAHSAPLFHLVLAGQTLNRAEGSGSHAGVATVDFYPAGLPHATSWIGESAGIEATLSGETAAQWKHWDLLPTAPVRLNGGLIAALLYVAYRQAFGVDSASGIEAEGFLCEAAAELQRMPRLQPTREGASRRLWQARERLYEAPLETISLTELAAQVELHPVYLSRAFHQAFGETVGDCLRKRRLDESCQRLRETDASLTQIAFAAGFSDQAHFSRIFRSYLGMPPGEYARAIRSRK
jgi:AraC family transcriptional regulator